MFSLYRQRLLSVLYLSGTYLILWTLIVAISLTGDYLLTLPRTRVLVHYSIALCDTTIHALLACLSWTMVILLYMGPIRSIFCFNPVLRDIALCGILAFAIDLDHAIMSRSFSIKAMTSLARRPMFHNTAILLLLSISMITLGTFVRITSYDSGQLSFLSRLGSICFVAFFTHHLRDALRHGFNLWPFYEKATAPVGLPLYFAIFFLLPLAVVFLTDLINDDYFGYRNIVHRNSHDMSPMYSPILLDEPYDESIV